MVRKRKTNYPIAGRPPKDPLQKVGRPIRALVTKPVMVQVLADMKSSDVNLSEFLRLAIYRQLEKSGLMTPELREDPTWATLREKGLV